MSTHKVACYQLLPSHMQTKDLIGPFLQSKWMDCPPTLLERSPLICSKWCLLKKGDWAGLWARELVLWRGCPGRFRTKRMRLTSLARSKVDQVAGGVQKWFSIGKVLPVCIVQHCSKVGVSQTESISETLFLAVYGRSSSAQGLGTNWHRDSAAGTSKVYPQETFISQGLGGYASIWSFALHCPLYSWSPTWAAEASVSVS